MLDLIVLHGEFSLFTVRGNFWYQIYRNRRKKVQRNKFFRETNLNLDLYYRLYIYHKNHKKPRVG